MNNRRTNKRSFKGSHKRVETLSEKQEWMRRQTGKTAELLAIILQAYVAARKEEQER